MFSFILKELWGGKSPTRSLLNYRLFQENLKGKILDLGSGGGDRYSTDIPKENTAEFILFDLKKGDVVDFEKDDLPSDDNTFDTILLLNVLEHIYNYPHLLKEIKRIKTNDGVLIGFVPFLMWYHPDHHDYFRYTHEALAKILTETGYDNVSIEAIHFGPFMAAFHMTYTLMPRVIRVVLFPFVYMLDLIFRKLRPGKGERYALGYYFTAK